ncbi:2Fe-2S iron-sulfur cluster binding domain-containing protein [Alteriqipengyuania sp. NZ-12B]|uniref:2Fe-2S iron-sulfur cluster binding domain-containing protein n=1 Tax=Alteriqipengyuania abyssalis TaxID=2860200 RepID=A0ABS7PCD1_9SPHN|nr:2Fe-2S iron-sulfur cluster-binding protein [Alteriqipengyuania abyssalis]MBY8336372.1 2Fe-2S iron-sulfur cluster binding domain-containing protein [Alteriqipengyuania abyssalis]
MKVTFIKSNGERVEAEAQAGDVLLRVAQAAGMPLEGTCEGQMACSTCHVLVAKEWFAQLPEASEDEEDMLDLAYGVRPTSRLSCQITLTDAFDGLEVTIPADAHDMSGR